MDVLCFGLLVNDAWIARRGTRGATGVANRDRRVAAESVPTKSLGPPIERGGPHAATTKPVPRPTGAESPARPKSPADRAGLRRASASAGRSPVGGPRRKRRGNGNRGGKRT